MEEFKQDYSEELLGNVNVQPDIKPDAQDYTEGFDALWTADSSIAVDESITTDPSKIIESQRDEILCLQDEINLLKEDNNNLNNTLNELTQKFNKSQILEEDYNSLVNFNKSLTRKLNTIMALYEAEQEKLHEIRKILG